jgi:hypothetical protein
MPAQSKAQQRLMGQAYAVKTGKKDPDEVSDKVASLAKGMTKKQLKDFASTKHKGLPETKESFVSNYEDFIIESNLNEVSINLSNAFDFFEINKRSYGFDTSENEYTVDFENRDDGEYELEYFVEPKGDSDNEFIVTNENIPFRILATIGAIAKKFIEKNDVKRIVWSPSFTDSLGKENNKKASQRNMLYGLLATLISPNSEVKYDGKLYSIDVTGVNEDYARVHPNPGMNVGGMGPVIVPEVGHFGATGSGDVPAPYSKKDKELMKKGKKKGVMPVSFTPNKYDEFLKQSDK